MASNGLVFCEEVSVVAVGLTKWLMQLVDSSRLLVCRLLLRRQQKDKTFLLADLIIVRC